LRTLKHIFIVNNNIERVWAFYTDIKHLEIITPQEMNLKIINCTTGQKLIQGSEIWIVGKIILLRKTTWHSRVTSLKLYEYVDEMLKGPFKKWRHLHKFHDIDQKQTQIIDEVDFELPYGIIGKLLFEGYTYNRLEKIFAHRKKATIKALENI
jgi:ligand-binding SRPBCC domain-containing protein